jgi:hypothetical protein
MASKPKRHPVPFAFPENDRFWRKSGKQNTFLAADYYSLLGLDGVGDISKVAYTTKLAAANCLATLA